MSVSVIIPVYNIENFVTRCAQSLFSQTLQDVEYIFVDDCSPDNSVRNIQECLTKFPERISQVRIVSHEYNKGLPEARNTGIRIASKDYIFHCDGDDYVEAELLEKMYNAAKEGDSDVVWCDWYLSFEKNERYMTQVCQETTDDLLRALLSGRLKYNVWNKMVRRKLYVDRNICFPSGYSMGEDMTMIKLVAYSQKVSYIPEALYHYVQVNQSAMTKSKSKNQLQELLYNTSDTITFILDKFGSRYNQELAFFQQSIKLPFLISDNRDDYLLWLKLYPESNKYIWKNKAVTIRVRLLQWLASKRAFWCLWIYYKVVFRVLYGIIYK